MVSGRQPYVKTKPSKAMLEYRKKAPEKTKQKNTLSPRIATHKDEKHNGTTSHFL